jgi:hypothetical protein
MVSLYCRLRLLHSSLLILTLVIFVNPLLAKETTEQKGLLWQIDKTGLESSYLFGTIHSEDKRVTRLPSAVQKRFKQAETLCLEVTMGVSTMFQATTGLFLKPSESLDELIEQKDYQYLVKVLSKQGMPEDAIKRLKPWAIMVIISMPEVKTGLFLDKILEEKATRLNKPIYGLETAEEQIQTLDSTPLAEQVILLKETLDYIDEMPSILEKLHQLYISRNLTKMMAFSKEYSKSEHHQPIVEAFMKRLVDDRNIRMVERMEKYLQKGKAFIAVGALHLPGEKGLLKLLEARGYRISSVY